MISGRFRGAYFGTTVLYAISGIMAIVISIVLRGQNSVDQLSNLVFTDDSLNISIAAGVFCLVSSVFGIFALVNTVERKNALIGYGSLILLVITLEVAVGAMLWFSTLQMREFMDTRWRTAFSSRQIAAFQEKFQCCGFAEASDRAVDSPNCPAAEAQTSTQFGCREAVAKSAMKMTETIFTALFGFVVVDVFAFLACVIMAQYRKDEERFKKMDSRGTPKI